MKVNLLFFIILTLVLAGCGTVRPITDVSSAKVYTVGATIAVSARNQTTTCRPLPGITALLMNSEDSGWILAQCSAEKWAIMHTVNGWRSSSVVLTSPTQYNSWMPVGWTSTRQMAFITLRRNSTFLVLRVNTSGTSTAVPIDMGNVTATMPQVPVLMSFASDEDGWMLIERQAWSGGGVSDLFTSIDGGRNWRLTNSRVGGQPAAILMTSRSTGYIATDSPIFGRVGILTTTSAGHHWTVVNLKVPRLYHRNTLAVLGMSYSPGQRATVVIGLSSNKDAVYARLGTGWRLQFLVPTSNGLVLSDGTRIIAYSGRSGIIIRKGQQAYYFGPPGRIQELAYVSSVRVIALEQGPQGSIIVSVVRLP